jgi:hypothetical protein
MIHDWFILIPRPNCHHIWIEQWLINVIINVIARSENVLKIVVLINTSPLELATSYHNICIWKPSLSANYRNASFNYRFRVWNNIWTIMLVPFEWSQPCNCVYGICWVDWKNRRIGWWEVPNGCGCLQLSSGKLWNVYDNNKTWWIQVNLMNFEQFIPLST